MLLIPLAKKAVTEKISSALRPRGARGHYVLMPVKLLILCMFLRRNGGGGFCFVKPIADIPDRLNEVAVGWIGLELRAQRRHTSVHTAAGYDYRISQTASRMSFRARAHPRRRTK
jgi:hypothetical protein